MKRKRDLDLSTGGFTRMNMANVVVKMEKDDSKDNSTVVSTDSGEERRARKSLKSARVAIAENDIRSQYAQIFTDAFNTMGHADLHKLLSTYCTEECFAVYKYIGNPNPVYGPVYCELVGIDAICNYWHAIFSALPDSVFEMQESKVRALPNGSCAIVLKFIFSGTKIFKISADSHETVVYADHPQSTTASESKFSGAVGQQTQTLALDGYLEKSQPMTLLGTLTFYTHADKKIFKIDVVYCVRS